LRKVTTENQEFMRAWIERILFQKFGEEAKFIGQEIDGNLVAVIAFTNFIPNACAMHIASVGENWMSKDLLWACFDYPFKKLEKKVILATMEASNEEAIKLNRHLGFQDKALIEDAHEYGDLLLMAMRKEDCKWLNLRCSLRKKLGD
jgi:RimJ/RimL family protein N-acetyltransferase